MPKGVYKRRNKREGILKAAAGVYAHYGFEGATIERMAEAAGVSKSLVVGHFGSKQELVKAIVDWTVAENLKKLHEIDAIPGLALRRREWLIHDLMKQDREQWCLVLGTVLVPSFEFQQRGELAKMLETTTATVLAHMDELLEPTVQSAKAYAYTTLCLHLGYVLDGQGGNFSDTLNRHMDNYLLRSNRENKGRARPEPTVL